MAIIIIFILLLVNIPFYKLAYKSFFRDSEEFFDALSYSFIPDFVSLFRGRLMEDWAASFKLQFFFLICVIPVIIEFMIFSSIFGHLYH